MNIVHGLLHALGIARVDDLAGHLVADPRLHFVGDHRGTGAQVDHCPPAAEQPAKEPDREGAGCPFLPVLPLARWVSISPGAMNSSTADGSLTDRAISGC